MDTATVLTTLNYNDFTMMDLLYIAERISEVRGKKATKNSFKYAVELMEQYDKEH